MYLWRVFVCVYTCIGYLRRYVWIFKVVLCINMHACMRAWMDGWMDLNYVNDTSVSMLCMHVHVVCIDF